MIYSSSLDLALANDKSATEDIEGMLDSSSSGRSLKLQKVFSRSRDIRIGNNTNNSKRSKRGSLMNSISSFRRSSKSEGRPARLSRPNAPSIVGWPPSLEFAHEAPIFHLRSPWQQLQQPFLRRRRERLLRSPPLGRQPQEQPGPPQGKRRRVSAPLRASAPDPCRRRGEQDAEAPFVVPGEGNAEAVFVREPPRPGGEVQERP